MNFVTLILGLNLTNFKNKFRNFNKGTTGKNGFIKNVNKTRPISVLSVHTLSDFNFNLTNLT